ncbi:MAG: hypothetical protein ACPG8W_03240 [Candidatus Promineifilaceae bacterium]
MRIVFALGTLLFMMMPQPVFSFSDGIVSLEIAVRDVHGAPLANEGVRIALPFETDVTNRTCVTDATGRCQWDVESGIYEVYWDRELDVFTQFASAENGLSTFGITVGDAPITYYFVLHTDDQLYFDAAPDATVPEPIIPTEAMLFKHEQVKVPSEGIEVSAETLPTTNTSVEIPSSPTNIWHILSFILAGLLIGGGAHLWSQRHAGGKRDA